jgi:formylmethanofuran dehydrogenase subunit D
MAPSDADRLGLPDGAAVLVRSEHGELHARVRRAGLRPGNVQVFFPEGNVLLQGGRRDGLSGVPDYNAIVELVPL